jgi:hypothetical protein
MSEFPVLFTLNKQEKQYNSVQMGGVVISVHI